MQYAWTVRQSLKNFQYFLRFTKKYIEEKSRNHIDFKKTIRYLNCRVFKVFFQKTVSHWRNNVFFYFYLSRNFFVSKINDCFFPVRLNDFKSFNSFRLLFKNDGLSFLWTIQVVLISFVFYQCHHRLRQLLFVNKNVRELYK